MKITTASTTGCYNSNKERSKYLNKTIVLGKGKEDQMEKLPEFFNILLIFLYDKAYFFPLMLQNVDDALGP